MVSWQSLRESLYLWEGILILKWPPDPLGGGCVCMRVWSHILTRLERQCKLCKLWWAGSLLLRTWTIATLPHPAGTSDSGCPHWREYLFTGQPLSTTSPERMAFPEECRQQARCLEVCRMGRKYRLQWISRSTLGGTQPRQGVSVTTIALLY